INRSTNNTPIECKRPAPGQLLNLPVAHREAGRIGHMLMVRLYAHMYFRKLSCTTGLLFVPVHFISCPRNRLAIWNAGLFKNHTDAIYLFHPVFDQVEMELTLTVEEHLLEFSRVFEDE